MSAVIFHIIAWPTLGCALLVWGFAPGALLRLIVLLYGRDHPQRRELPGELYGVPRIERPFWVAEQLEAALFEGLGGRIAARRTIPALVHIAQPGRGRMVQWEMRLPAGLPAGSRRAPSQVKALVPAVSRAVATGTAKQVSFGANPDPWLTVELPVDPDVYYLNVGLGPQSEMRAGVLLKGHSLLADAAAGAVQRHQQQPGAGACTTLGGS
jgi:hypothetical protein